MQIDADFVKDVALGIPASFPTIFPFLFVKLIKSRGQNTIFLMEFRKEMQELTNSCFDFY